MKNVYWKSLMLAGGLAVLAGCGGGNGDAQNAEATQPAAPAQTESAAANAPAQTESAAANAPAQTESAAANAPAAPQGAMTAATEPQQPQAPADLGAKVYGLCVGCHGPQGGGGVGPKLAGQSAQAIKDKMHAYKAGKQVGPQTAMMAPIAQGMSDADIEAVANYIATHFK